MQHAALREETFQSAAPPVKQRRRPGINSCASGFEVLCCFLSLPRTNTKLLTVSIHLSPRLTSKGRGRDTADCARPKSQSECREGALRLTSGSVLKYKSVSVRVKQAEGQIESIFSLIIIYTGKCSTSNQHPHTIIKRLC